MRAPPLLILFAGILVAAPFPDGSGAVAQTEPVVSRTPADQGLEWERSPSVADLTRFHPKRGTRRWRDRAFATVRCTPDARGGLRCEAISEEPAGQGYGEGAERLMNRARVRTRDGSSPEGRVFDFTVRFGFWPEHLMPRSFQPMEAGLSWIVRPSMRDWDGAGQARNETYRADFDCIARADGSLDCTLVGSEPAAGIDRFLDQAREAMARARVQRIDDQPLEGTPLRYSLARTRQDP